MSNCIYSHAQRSTRLTYKPSYSNFSGCHVENALLLHSSELISSPTAFYLFSFRTLLNFNELLIYSSLLTYTGLYENVDKVQTPQRINTKTYLTIRTTTEVSHWKDKQYKPFPQLLQPIFQERHLRLLPKLTIAVGSEKYLTGG